MEIIFTVQAQADLRYWRRSGNKAIQTKISELLQSILDTPYDGIGKPEALRYELSGSWSRRINTEHRLVYRLDDGVVYVYSLRGHYKNK